MHSSHLQINKVTLNRSFQEMPFSFNDNLKQKIVQNEFIQRIEPVILESAILKSETEINGVVLKGIDLGLDSSYIRQSIVEGRLPSSTEDYAKEILLSRQLVKLLNVKLQEEIFIYFIKEKPRARKVKIVGIYDSGIPELDENYAWVDIELLRRINDWEKDQVGHLEIWTDNSTRISEYKNLLYASVPQELDMYTTQELLPQFFDWFLLLDRNIILVIVLIVLVAGFNMVSVLLIMLMERTPMIGLLGALGMPSRGIQNLFAFQSMYLISRGLILGNVLALLLLFSQKHFKLIPLDPENYYMHFVPVSIDWCVWLLVNLVSVITIVVLSYLPTFLIQRISLVKALKYKD